MLLKLLFIAILVYFAVRAVRNLLRAVRHDPRGPATFPPRPAPAPSRPRAERATRPERRADVEDAKFVDL